MTTLPDAVCCMDCETIYSTQQNECPACLGRTNFKLKRYVPSLRVSPKEAKYGIHIEERFSSDIQEEGLDSRTRGGSCIGRIVLDKLYPFRIDVHKHDAPEDNPASDDNEVFKASVIDASDNICRKFREMYSGLTTWSGRADASPPTSLDSCFDAEGNYKK